MPLAGLRSFPRTLVALHSRFQGERKPAAAACCTRQAAARRARGRSDSDSVGCSLSLSPCPAMLACAVDAAAVQMAAPAVLCRRCGFGPGALLIAPCAAGHDMYAAWPPAALPPPGPVVPHQLSPLANSAIALVNTLRAQGQLAYPALSQPAADFLIPFPSIIEAPARFSLAQGRFSFMPRVQLQAVHDAFTAHRGDPAGFRIFLWGSIGYGKVSWHAACTVGQRNVLVSCS